ncbi:MAG: ZIP family metal transporter [Promethearchaeota archaeon]
MGSIGAIAAASLFMILNEDMQKKIIPSLLSFAIGVLLTASLLGLIPEAIETSGGEPHLIMPTVLIAILGFFFLEKIVAWRNCRDNTCEVHSHASGPIILVGDALHNLTDGIVIAAAFLTEFHLGIIVGITILSHEIPQETGDFAILLHSGYSKKKAILFNALSSSTTIPSAIIAYFILNPFEVLVPFLLAVSAASFIYIALTDLTPELHKDTQLKYSLRQLLLIILGIVLMWILLSLGIHEH